jgi:predicted ester cyclase
MGLTREQMDTALQEHFDYELKDDVAGMVSTLSRDVRHEVIGAPTGELHGPEQARGFYEGLFKDLDGHNFRSISRYYGDNFVVDVSEWEGVAAGVPFGIPGNGRPLSFRLLHVLEFNDDGKISLENVWLDYPAIFAQLQAPG